LQAGRLDQPEGRNALDLFQAVLLAQPDNAEAQKGLARTMELMVAQAADDLAADRRQEAGRLVRRVLAVEPKHPTALALQVQISPPDTPSRQLQREQVVAASPSPGNPPASQPAPGAKSPQAASARPAVAAPTTLIPPTQPAPGRTSRSVQALPDPLAPRYTNAPTRTGSAGARTARAYGAPINNSLPTAGLAAPQKVAPSAEPEPAMAAGVVAADEFDSIASRDPVYPAAALRNKISGWVELEFTIAPNGAVRDVAIVGSEPRGVFESAASDALAEWRFRPRVVNGQPVAQRSRITMRFDVEG
jgi:protein TonB